MSRHQSHLSSAIKIIKTHKPGEPLQHHLKKFFAADKKYGSKDRKTISGLCYNFYRIGKALPAMDTGHRVLAATFLCNEQPNNLLAELQPEYNSRIQNGIEEKCEYLGIITRQLFPFSAQLSPQINDDAFAKSFLKQPLVYLRIRPGRTEKLLNKLTDAALVFTKINETCIAFKNAVKIDEAIALNKDAVVQDAGSQQVFKYLLPKINEFKSPVEVWDCCAASGGKSILLYDIFNGRISLTVTDIRENILQNLRNRFKDAGIKNYTHFVADLSANANMLFTKKFDIVICDVPCTGSGTWARTPEQAAFFKESDIAAYEEKQQKIASAAATYLNGDGILFYITCSVFVKENENMVQKIVNSNNLKLLHSEYIKGYENLADTMFVAVFKK